MKPHETHRPKCLRRSHRPPPLFAAAWLVLFTTIAAVAAPRAPQPPWPESSLRIWQFDEPYLASFQTEIEAALVVDSAVWAESWSGYALNRQGHVVSPIALPMANTNRWNVAPEVGAVRFWFKPDWSSASTLLGKGPGQYGRLVELTTASGKDAVVWWSLYVSPEGDAIFVSGEGPDGARDCLKADISWLANDWHLIAFSYGPGGTLLHIDGQLAAYGEGVLGIPVMLATGTTLVVGSDSDGKGVANGQFEELCTFNEPLDEWGFDYYYRGVSRVAALGPISMEEELAMELMMAQALLNAEVGGGLFARLEFDESNPCPTNGPLFMTNLWCELSTNTGWNYTFDVAGGDPGVRYDVFASVDMTTGTETNGAWYWVANAYQCSTVVLTNQPEVMTLYILGTPQDSDADGLTDAWEHLVTKTNPDDPDTDHDGLSDYYELLSGLSPHVVNPLPTLDTISIPTCAIP